MRLLVILGADTIKRMTPYQEQLRKNIGRYAWYKIFTKRVYLPLITIQLVNVGHVTIEQLGIMVVLSSIVQALLQVPAGYIADRWGNRRAIILGASIAVGSPLLYAFMPTFWGGLLASVLFFGGYAFQAGAVEAFMHSTLTALGRASEYTKVLGRAQAYGLVGNVVLITLVPLTYQVDHRLPFLLGFVSLVGMWWLTLRFVHPPAAHPAMRPNPRAAWRQIATLPNLLLFLLSGFLAGVSNKATELKDLLLQSLGVPVVILGAVAALGSLAGAVMGWYVHWFDRIRALWFYLLDVAIMAGSVALLGASQHPAVAISAFVVFAGYTRVRTIVLQAKLLEGTQPTYKATLLSALNSLTVVGDVVAISLLTAMVTRHGYLAGHVWFGASVGLIGGLLWAALIVAHRTRPAATTGPGASGSPGAPPT